MFDDLVIQKISKKRHPDKVIKSLNDVEKCPFCNSEISLHMDMPITYWDYLDAKLYNCLGAEKHKFSTVRDRVRNTTYLEIFDRTGMKSAWPNLNELIPEICKKCL